MGGGQRMMKKSILTKEDLGEFTHENTLTVGSEQFMVFQPDDPPPIFDSAVEKLDQEVPTTNKIRKLTVAELKRN